MTNFTGLMEGMRDFGHTITTHIPSWMQDGLNRRKRGQLGFRLMVAHQTGQQCRKLCDTIASFKQASGLSRYAKPREHIAHKSRTHNLLSQVTYVAPTLALGLVMTVAFNLAGLVTQVSDTIRLDSGQAFLCALEDHGVDLENADEIEAALNEPAITKDIYTNAIKSGIIEAGFGVASFGVGNGVSSITPALAEFIPIQKISDNLAQSAARLFPSFSQVAIKTAASEATNSAINSALSAMSVVADKSVEQAGKAIKSTVVHDSITNVQDAMSGKNPEKAAAMFRVRARNNLTRRSVHIDYADKDHPIWAQGKIQGPRTISEDEERELGFDVVPLPIRQRNGGQALHI